MWEVNLFKLDYYSRGEIIDIEVGLPGMFKH